MNKLPDETENPLNPLYIRRVLARHPEKISGVCATLKRQMINAGADSKTAKRKIKNALYELRGAAMRNG